MPVDPKKTKKRTPYRLRRNERFGVIFFCDYCNRFVSNNPGSRTEHLQSEGHIKRMEQYYNTLKREVTAKAAEVEEKKRLVENDPVRLKRIVSAAMSHDWRHPLLPRSSQQLALENIVQYVNAPESGVAAAPPPNDVPAREPTSTDVAFGIIAPQPPVSVGGGIIVGGAPPAAMAQMRPTVIPVIMPSVRVGSVVLRQTTDLLNPMGGPDVKVEIGKK